MPHHLITGYDQQLVNLVKADLAWPETSEVTISWQQFRDHNYHHQTGHSDQVLVTSDVSGQARCYVLGPVRLSFSLFIPPFFFLPYLMITWSNYPTIIGLLYHLTPILGTNVPVSHCPPFLYHWLLFLTWLVLTLVDSYFLLDSLWLPLTPTRYCSPH